MHVFVFLLIAVAFLLLTFSMHLFCTKKGSRMMNSLLGFSFLARFFQVCVFLLAVTSYTVLFPVVQEVYILLYFVSLVSSYLYIRCFINGEEHLKRSDLIHLIPIIFAIIHILPYSLFAKINWDIVANQIITGGQLSITERTGFFSASFYNKVQIVFSVGYLLSSWQVVFTSKFFNRVWDINKKWILYFISTSSFFKVLGFVVMIYGTVERSYTNSVVLLSICCIVLLFMLLFVIYQPQILYGYLVLSENYIIPKPNESQSKIVVSLKPLSNIDLPKSLSNYSDTEETHPVFLHQNCNDENSKDIEFQNKIYQNIINLLENDKIYKDPYLSICRLSEIIGCNEKYISGAISNNANMNYSKLINSYRINEAKRLIYNNKYENLNEVMKACGFNSRTTFYTAFNKYTGMSPKQFRDQST